MRGGVGWVGFERFTLAGAILTVVEICMGVWAGCPFRRRLGRERYLGLLFAGSTWNWGERLVMGACRLLGGDR